MTPLPLPTATRDWRLYLDVLIEALGRVVDFVGDRTAAEFAADERTQGAVMLAFGEAGRMAGLLPDAVRVRAAVNWEALRDAAELADPARLLGGDVPLDRLWAGSQQAVAWLAGLRTLLAEADRLPDRGDHQAAPEVPPGMAATGSGSGPPDSAPDELDAPHYVPRTAPLRRDEALRLLREHAPELERRFGVRPLALFGSVARDDARADSDVDVLVEYVRQPGMRDFFGAVDLLEALFRTRVDLGTFERLKPRIQPYVRRDMIRVA